MWTVLTDGARFALGPEGAALALAAMGLNLHVGYTGVLNFGQAGYMMVGAYGIAVSVQTFGLSFWVGCLLALVASLVVTLLLGLPTLRLRTDYFAITSLGLAEVLRLLARSQWSEGTTGGVNGIQGFAGSFYDLNPFPFGYYGFGAVRWTEQQMWVLTVGWALVVLGTVTVWLLIRSPWGRVVQAIRDDEFVPRSLGKNVYAYKLQSLAVGGVLGSLGGMVLAVSQQDVHPETYLTILTFFAFAAAILGGLGTVWGPVVGAVLFWFVLSAADSGLRMAVGQGLVGDELITPQRVAAVRFILTGVILVLLISLRPQGLLGGRAVSVMRARKAARPVPEPGAERETVGASS
jgi:neutral amino acid transport system permease protein